MTEDNASLLGRREFLGSLTVAATGGFSVASPAAGEQGTELAPV